MLSRWVSFVIWAAVAASAVFWGLRLFTRPLPLPPNAAVVSASPPPVGNLSRLFGADKPVVAPAAAKPVSAVEASRYQLIGVVAPRADRARVQGIALIAVDGKPPRAFRVGARIEDDQVLQAVHARGASIGPRGGAPLATLELPAVPPASTAAPGPPVARPAMPFQPPPRAAGAAVRPTRPAPQSFVPPNAFPPAIRPRLPSGLTIQPPPANLLAPQPAVNAGGGGETATQ